MYDVYTEFSPSDPENYDVKCKLLIWLPKNFTHFTVIKMEKRGNLVARTFQYLGNFES